MALLTVNVVPAAGAAKNLVAVSASDTISANDIGTKGVILEVANASGGSITVSLSDPGSTAAGNPGTVTAQSIANSATKRFFVGPGNVNPATGVATVTYSGTSSVTAEAFRI